MISALRLGARELRRNPGCRCAVADDETSLHPCGQADGQAGDRATGEHPREQQKPDAQSLVTPERPVDDPVAGEPDQKRIERGDPEQSRHLVQCRLAQEVLIAVIETGDLADQNHRWNRQ